jgi:hypothetical protein
VHSRLFSTAVGATIVGTAVVEGLDVNGQLPAGAARSWFPAVAALFSLEVSLTLTPFALLPLRGGARRAPLHAPALAVLLLPVLTQPVLARLSCPRRPSSAAAAHAGG